MRGRDFWYLSVMLGFCIQCIMSFTFLHLLGTGMHIDPLHTDAGAYFTMFAFPPNGTGLRSPSQTLAGYAWPHL